MFDCEGGMFILGWKILKRNLYLHQSWVMGREFVRKIAGLKAVCVSVKKERFGLLFSYMRNMINQRRTELRLDFRHCQEVLLLMWHQIGKMHWMDRIAEVMVLFNPAVALWVVLEAGLHTGYGARLSPEPSAGTQKKPQAAALLQTCSMILINWAQPLQFCFATQWNKTV